MPIGALWTGVPHSSARLSMVYGYYLLKEDIVDVRVLRDVREVSKRKRANYLTDSRRATRSDDQCVAQLLTYASTRSLLLFLH